MRILLVYCASFKIVFFLSVCASISMLPQKYFKIRIVEHGNCLFRAMSYCISRSENFYTEIRDQVVQNIVTDFFFILLPVLLIKMLFTKLKIVVVAS